MKDELFVEKYGSEGQKVFLRLEDGSIVEKDLKVTKAHSVCQGFISILKDVFLPQGFPDSVHRDYIPYQIWDTVQAFASTIMGILTTHSIMQGIGVGNTSSTPLVAAITWILKDGTGMIGRIIFAWWNGTNLDGQCKKWRLFADVLNDAAMGIELLIPYVQDYALYVLCISTMMKSVVGVAGGATRAALTQHQALQNNLADVSAKDGSQETCVNLIASFFGIYLLSFMHNKNCLMELYISLVSIHLYANYLAVRALHMNSLNEDRLALVLKNYLLRDTVPDPEWTNKEESLLLLGQPTKDLCGFQIKMGVSLGTVAKKDSQIHILLESFQHRNYLIALDQDRSIIHVGLRKGAQPCDALQAYFHSYLCAVSACMMKHLPLNLLMHAEGIEPSRLLMRLRLLMDSPILKQDSGRFEGHYMMNSMVSEEYECFVRSLEQKGWDLNKNLLPVGVWRFT